MIYLYYYDGKLSDSPTKMNSDVEIVERNNRWYQKICASNGFTKCYNRLSKISLNANPDRDYYILTNSDSLIKRSEKDKLVQCTFIWDESRENWVMHYSATVRIDSDIELPSDR